MTKQGGRRFGFCNLIGGGKVKRKNLSIRNGCSFLSLSPNVRGSSSFSRNGMPVSRAETVGVVVARDLKPGKFLRFIIVDGTGCIPCVLCLNHLTSPYFAKHNPASVRVNAQTGLKFSSLIQLSVVARVRGRITGYRGMVQITVSGIVLERDPNAQVLHWLDCMWLARNWCLIASSMLP